MLTEEIVTKIATKEPFVWRIGTSVYFLYYAATGPEQGWRLYRDEDDGEETMLCEVPTLESLESAAELFGFELRKVPAPLVYWVNVYRDRTTGAGYKTRSKADEACLVSSNRIACLKLVGVEGEGLKCPPGYINPN